LPARWFWLAFFCTSIRSFLTSRKLNDALNIVLMGLPAVLWM